MDKPAARLAVTIATQRSGTKFLVSSLNAGTVVHSFGEALKADAPPPSLKSFLAAWLPGREGFAFTHADMTRLLDDFAAALVAASPRPVAHLDIMYNNLGAFAPVFSWPHGAGRRTFLLRWLRASGVSVIHLVRENLAECFASDLIAQARGVFHTHAPLGPEAAVRLTPSLADARAYIAPIQKARRLVRDAFEGYPRYAEITYPHFIAANSVAPSVSMQLSRVIGAPAGSGRLFGPSSMQRTAPDKTALIANFAEIEELWARMEGADPEE